MHVLTAIALLVSIILTPIQYASTYYKSLIATFRFKSCVIDTTDQIKHRSQNDEVVS